MSTDTVVLDGSCRLVNRLDGSCQLITRIDGNPFTVLKVRDFEYYTGSYSVTPSAEEQILNTADLMMSGDITINPIPSNYGLITWNGSALTVS